MHNIYKIRQIFHTIHPTYNNRLGVLYINYRKLAHTFITLGLFILISKGYPHPRIRQNELKVEIAQPSLTI